MKKQLLQAAIFLLGTITVEAQKTETAQLLVHYKFIHVMDTTDRAHPFIENMVLYIGKSAGAYWSYDKIAKDEQFKKAYALAAASSPDGNVMINRSGGSTNTQYYQYPKEQKLFINEEMMGNDYLIESPLPVIDWKISGDTTTIGGLHCQKATGHFKGRDYIVWFCPDIPVLAGPWKLNGLPGVIVDVHDSKNEVAFVFNGIEKAAPSQQQQIGDPNIPEKDLPPILRGLNYDPNQIKLPIGVIKITQKEFDKLKETIRKDPKGFAKAVEAASIADGRKTENAIGSASPGSVFNNPIELSGSK